MNKYYKMLELDKIINFVKEEVVLEKNETLIDLIPLMNDLSEIELALNETDEAVRLLLRMGRMPLYFSSDVRQPLSKVEKAGVLTEEELLLVGNLLDSIKGNFLYLEKLENAEIDAPYFEANVEKLQYFKDLNLKIKNIITPYGEIKDDASANLKTIRKRIKDIEKSIQSKLQEIMNKNASKLTQSIVSIRNGRYVIPVRNDSKNIVKGIIHDQSASGETVFIEPTIINQLNNELNRTYEDEKQEIYHILRMISIAIADHVEELLDSYQVLLHLDRVFAKATYANRIHASKPKVNTDGIMDLIQCRHPLLKVDNVVSNNVSLGKTYKGIVITGPNTGGKTVLLKTVGLLSLMVKAGMLVPCDEQSNVMIFDNVYSDIGDEQSIDQNLSTFSSHLKNVIDIMNAVTNDSLVLLDELGSGTDPLEGSGLAISIFDELIAKNCLIIATSHYSELKLHAYNSDTIMNASVEFNEETLKPTYKLLMGVPGMSNALKIAKTLGLNPKIIEKAEQYVYTRNDNVNQMLDKLIHQSKELDSNLKTVESLKTDLSKKKQEIDQEKLRIQQAESEILKRANEEATKHIQKSMNDVNELLDELKELKNKNVKLHEIAEVTHKARNLETKMDIPRSQEETKEIEVNSRVFVTSFETYGTVVNILKNNKFEVLIGNATMKLDKKQLRLSDVEEKPIRKTGTTISLKPQVANRLDLRGMRYEEAEPMIDKFLDDAVYGNLNTVTIVHGFGTGVIRKLVQDALKEHRSVESFRYGGAGEGGQGATVVTLK